MATGYKLDLTTGFNSGEFTPALAGRIDFDDYKFSARLIENLIPEVQGGLKKFYGTAHIQTLDELNDFTLIPFSGAEQPIVLLLHDGILSVIAGDEYYDSDIKISIQDCSKIKYSQQNDIIYCVHPDNPPFTIQYFGFDAEKGQHIFGADNIEFIDEPYFPIGWTGNYNGSVVVSGNTGTVTIKTNPKSTSGRIKLPDAMKGIVGTRNIIPESGLSTDVLSIGTNYDTLVYSLGTTKVEILRKRGSDVSVISTSNIGTEKTLLLGKVETTTFASSVRPPIGGGGTSVSTPSVRCAYKEISSNQVLNAIKISFPDAQWAGFDIVVSTAPSGHQVGDEYAVRFTQSESTSEETRPEFTSIRDGVVYTLRNNYPEYIQTGEYSTIDADIPEFLDTNVVGRKVKFLLEASETGVEVWSEGLEVLTGKVVYSDNSYYVAKNGGTTGKIQPTHKSGIRSDGVVKWEYIHSGTGTATIVSVDSSTQLTAIVDGYLPVLSLTPPAGGYIFDTIQWSIWGYKQLYPTQVFFYKNRLGFFCNTDGFGCWLSLSKTDNYLDFATETYGANLDTDAIITPVVGHKNNNVNWVLPAGQRLYFGSASGEYVLYGDNTGAITPINTFITTISSIGGADIKALKFKQLNLFVGSLQNEIYSLSYDYNIDDFVPDNIGYMSSHLLATKVKDWDALNSIDRNIYFITEDKELRIINYISELKKLGYYRLNLNGDVYGVCSSTTGFENSIYFIVKRGEKYFIERADSERPSYMISRRTFLQETPEEVDIQEFAGQKVYIYNESDGQYLLLDFPENGKFTAPESFKNFSIGLPMYCLFHGQALAGEKAETLQQKSVSFTIRLKDSGAFEFGTSHDYNKYYMLDGWSTVAGQKYDEMHKLLTGDIQLPLPQGYMNKANVGNSLYPNDTSVGLNLKMQTPEPFNILLIGAIYV